MLLPIDGFFISHQHRVREINKILINNKIKVACIHDPKKKEAPYRSFKHLNSTFYESHIEKRQTFELDLL